MAKSLALKNGYEQDASQDIKGEYAGGCLCCLVRSQYCAQACRPHCARTVSHSVLPTLSHSGPALPLARAHTRFAQRKRSHRRPCNISHPVPPWPHPPAALGLANIAGSACCCYNATGSFSRSAVNNDVGAKTQLASGGWAEGREGEGRLRADEGRLPTDEQGEGRLPTVGCAGQAAALRGHSGLQGQI